MKKVIWIGAAVVAVCAHMAQAATQGDRFKQQQVSSTGRVPKDGFIPAKGFVPDAATAIGIAQLVLTPIYGADNLAAQQPFTAELRGGVWVVSGSIQGPGGVAEADIDKRTGRILRVIHGK